MNSTLGSISIASDVFAYPRTVRWDYSGEIIFKSDDCCKYDNEYFEEFIMDILTKYINNDKTIINLPVPLGTVLYCVVLKCGDFCHWQKQKFNKTFERSQCFAESPCHTVNWHIYEMPLKLSNIEYVLKDFGVWLFTDKREAERVAAEIIEKNRKTMSNHGFMMTEDGYGLIKENEGDIS